MNRFILIIFSLSMISCSIDRTIVEVTENENNTLIDFQKLPSENILKITDTNEPGEKLMLCLTFIEKENRKSVSKRSVKFYHTSTNGDYEQTDPNDESTARLSGQSITNTKGQMYIETILPGDYGSSDDNRHIHTTVFGAKPEAYDIHFKQYTTYLGKKFTNNSDQHFLADLKRTKENELVCFLTIEVKKTNQKE